VVINTLNGVAGPILLKILPSLPLKIKKLNFTPDGNFPKGEPNPLLPVQQKETSKAVKVLNADFSAAFDGDADRVFFTDEKGKFIPAFYITALLLEKKILRSTKKIKIVTDTRSVWTIKKVVDSKGAKLILNRAGHSFIKERMRKENALFGAETSGHYYFKDFYFCDSGIIPFLMMLEILSTEEIPLSKLIAPYYSHNFAIREKNFKVKNGQEIINQIKNKYRRGKQNFIDGLSVDFKSFRFNLRPSNTEPLIRLNLEAKNKKVMKAKAKEITGLIKKLAKK